jgi:AraC-like DNA-binding protein
MKRPEESVIASNYAALVLRQTRAMGIDDAVILENTQLGPAHLDGSATSINGRQFLQLIENVATQVTDTAFPVHYGVNMSVGTHGIMGYALLTSATARDAFNLALRYYKTVFSMMSIAEEPGDEQVHFVFDVEAETPAQEAYMIEGIFSGLLSVSRFLLGFSSLPCIMRYRISKPPHAGIYQQLFGVQPEFGCERNEIIIDRELLNIPLPANDPQTRKMAEAQCEKMLEAMEQFCSFPERIKKILKTNPAALPTLPEVADQLNMHPRTLGRRLSEYNTCFKELLEEVKSELAVQYLSDPNLLIDDIAFSLNYNDATSFYRAFKRWTGNSPSSYRPKMRAHR